MIFRFSEEPGYGYDDYGSGRALTFDHIGHLFDGYQLTAYYPSTAAIGEGGRRRGCAVLVRDLQQNDAMDWLKTLCRAESGRAMIGGQKPIRQSGSVAQVS